MANLFGRMKSSLVYSIFNAEIPTRSTTSRLGDTAGLMIMSGVVLNGHGPNPIVQSGYEARTEDWILLAAETMGTPLPDCVSDEQAQVHAVCKASHWLSNRPSGCLVLFLDLTTGNRALRSRSREHFTQGLDLMSMYEASISLKSG